MKKLKIAALFLAFFALIAYGCKKEELSDQQFVQEHFIGKWPLKSRIILTIEGKDTTTNDTTRFSPIDTLIFTADGKYSKGNVTASYTIDEKGENLSIGTTPPTNWHIKFLRNTSIVLSQTRTETVNGQLTTYYTEENLVK